MNPTRTALITGGAQGIGRAIAAHLSGQGIRVIAMDVDSEAIEDLKAERPAIYGVVADVSNEPDVSRVISHIRTQFGRLDILVNNAAIVNPVSGPIAELPLEKWNRVIATNLTGPCICTKHAVPLLLEVNGVIINIASTRALQSEPHTEAYAASKGGLVALTHALAVSLGPKIRVNCISPGWISTAHLQKKSNRTTPRFTEADHLQHPVGRVGKPEDIAAMVSFLASPEAEFITGQNIVVDGGMTRKMIYEE